jgi:hypothetical protein
MMAEFIGNFNNRHTRFCRQCGYAAIHPPSPGTAAVSQAASPHKKLISASKRTSPDLNKSECQRALPAALQAFLNATLIACANLARSISLLSLNESKRLSWQ